MYFVLGDVAENYNNHFTSSEGQNAGQVNLIDTAYSSSGIFGDPSPPPPVPSPPSIAGIVGDPHIAFAHGGRADFRGSHRALYAFVSSPGYQFAPYFQEVDFWFDAVTGLKQLIHGTFMTQATWRMRTSSGKELLVTADAMHKGELTVLVLGGGGSVQTVAVKPWQRVAFDDVRIETRMLTASVESPTWQVNVTAKPIYGLVPPLLNETHVHGKWDEEQRRLDILINGAFPQPDAHGIIGQSFRDATVRHGKLDEYYIWKTPARADSDGMLPPMTTSAQAEGAIEGVYTDYKLPNPWSTDFVFSHYDSATTQVSKGVAKRTASTSEWDGKKREL